MRILAYTAARYANVTQEAIGGQVTLWTCPPLTDSRIDPDALRGYDLIVFNLHGEPDTPAWWGDQYTPALTANTIAKMNLYRAGIFALNCYLGDDDHPMREALYHAGAAYLIAGSGKNYGGHTVLQGADRLLHWYVRFLRKGMTPEASFVLAKKAMFWTPQVFSRKKRQALEDAREFQFWRWIP
jgi:hypothetical protein